MLIVYSGDNEALICAATREAEMLASWFASGTGRDVKDYDRSVSSLDIVVVRSRLSVTND